jgi:hypothetical protein
MSKLSVRRDGGGRSRSGGSDCGERSRCGAHGGGWPSGWGDRGSGTHRHGSGNDNRSHCTCVAALGDWAHRLLC